MIKPTPTPTRNETVMITSHGFVPEVLTVGEDEYLNFANFSESVVDLESDSTKDKSEEGSIIGKIEVGNTSPMLRYTNKGTYYYRNNLKPYQAGTIVVQ